MSTTTIVLFLILDMFYGRLSSYYINSIKSDPIDVSAIEFKLWHENTPLSAFSTLFVSAARFTSILFLIFIGYKSNWFNPIILYLASLAINTFIHVFVKSYLIKTTIALLGFLAIPVVAVFLYLSI